MSPLCLDVKPRLSPDYGVETQLLILQKKSSSRLGISITGGSDIPFPSDGISIRNIEPSG